MVERGTDGRFIKGFKHTQEWKDAISAKFKGRTISEEQKNKLRIANTGKKLSEETKAKISKAQKGKKKPNISGENNHMFGKKKTAEWKEKVSKKMSGENHWNWQGGITAETKKICDKRWVKNNKERSRRIKQLYKARRRSAGSLTKEDIQLVYEDNIKKYGTLTCCLCKKEISFGSDSLEHLTPLSRGGTNDVSNLDISHKRCNSKKNTKTLKEWECVYAKGHTFRG